MNRQKLLLSALVAALLLSAVYSYWKMPRQKTATSLTYAPGAVAKARKTQPQAISPDARVRLDLLNRDMETFSGFRRNIFGPLIQEKRKKTTRHRVMAAKPAPLSSPPPLEPVISPVQREMAQFTFLGFLKKDNRKTIFLTSNNEIFLVRKGDTIAGRYQVANITDEALTIRSTEDSGEVSIPLIENRPLNVQGQ